MELGVEEPKRGEDVKRRKAIGAISSALCGAVAARVTRRSTLLLRNLRRAQSYPRNPGEWGSLLDTTLSDQ
jgi:hypothetical protein